jgi:ubiquinone/menaquinone biosynthesis C-methylase UbiE
MDLHERYTHGHHESVLRSHSWRTVDNSAAYLRPYLKAGAKVLDVGSGPGTITVDLAKRVDPGEVVGIDSSREIVAQASALAATSGARNVRFEIGDAYHLDAEDDTFDVVHAHQVLQHVADPVAVLAEFRRVTKPGGVVAARDVDWGGTMWAPMLPGLADWMRINQAVQRYNGGEPFAGRYLKRWALQAGFDSIDSSASIWCFASDDERSWWGESWSVRATESDFGRHALDARIADEAVLRSVAAAWLEWSMSNDGWYAMPHGEIIAHV